MLKKVKMNKNKTTIKEIIVTSIHSIAITSQSQTIIAHINQKYFIWPV